MSQQLPPTVLVCEKTIVDKANRISIINLFNQINTIGLPARFPPFSVFIRIIDAKVGESLKMDFEIKAPSGVVVIHMKGESQVTTRNLDIPLEIPSLSFPEEGVYQAIVSVAEMLKGVAEFEVTNRA